MSIRDFLLAEDRGVSPVIGVILMVAITVILAAVIATFVMNMGPPETTMPNAQFSWANDSDGVTVTHDGGDAVKKNNLKLVVTNDADTENSKTPSNGELKATGSMTVVVSNSSSHYPVSAELIWENPNSDQTQILSEWES